MNYELGVFDSWNRSIPLFLLENKRAGSMIRLLKYYHTAFLNTA